jgi:DNA-binding transcriptional LysR family regulator
MPLKDLLELNTLDAFRGVVRPGDAIALLPQTAMLEARNDSSLAVLPLAPPTDATLTSGKFKGNFSRQVVLVTTSDRLKVPPIAHFCQLVRQFVKSSLF